jgi:hypothetical protein
MSITKSNLEKLPFFSNVAHYVDQKGYQYNHEKIRQGIPTTRPDMQSYLQSWQTHLEGPQDPSPRA